MLCSVVKHAGSGQSTKEVQGETRANTLNHRRLAGNNLVFIILFFLPFVFCHSLIPVKIKKHYSCKVSTIIPEEESFSLFHHSRMTRPTVSLFHYKKFITFHYSSSVLEHHFIILDSKCVLTVDLVPNVWLHSSLDLMHNDVKQCFRGSNVHYGSFSHERMQYGVV